MKKLIIILFFIVCGFNGFSQFRFPSTDSLHRYTNRFVTNSAINSFTDYRMNTLIHGIINWIDSARLGTGGSVGVDTIYALNDSTIRYKKNGVNYTFNLRGRYWTLQQVLTNGSTLTTNSTITLADSITFTSGKFRINDTLKLPSVIQKTDTTTYKPVVVDAAGNIFKFDRWPGGSLNLQQVTDNGNKTTNAIFTRKQLYTPKIASDSLAEPNFSFYIMPDLQGMTAYFPFKIHSMFDYVVARKSIENIQGVITVGDLTQLATTSEFLLMDTVFDQLDAADIKYLAVGGNHDYNGGNISGGVRPSTSQWSAIFNDARYTGKPWYPGYHFGTSTMNHYIKFDVGSYKFLMLTMEFLPPDSVIDWGSRVIDSFPDHKIIISTHAYMTAWGEKSTDTSAHSTNHYGLTNDNSGDSLWHKLIKKKENIVMVLGGHFINGTVENNNWVRRYSTNGDSGNVVHQIFMNYQRDSTGGFAIDNGQGWLMKMRFNPSTGDVFTSLYSPYLNQYDSRVDSFNIAVPALAVKTDMGVKGSLQVNKEVRANGGLYLGSDIAKYSVPIVGDQQKVIGINNLNYKSGKLTLPNAHIVDLTPARIPYITTAGKLHTTPNLSIDTVNTRIGIATTTPLKRLDVRGTFGASTVGGYRATFFGATQASFNFAHAGSDYGLAISRHQTGSQRGANQMFFRSNHSNPDSLGALANGDEIGRTSYHGVNLSKVIRIAGDYIVRVAAIDSNTIGSEHLWATGNSTIESHGDPSIRKMLLTTDGNLQISSDPNNTGFKLWVRGSVASHIDSTPTVTSVTNERVLLQDLTTGQYKNITAANLGVGSGLTGSGTTNTVTKWTGATSLGNSILTDNGTSIGVSVTSPGASTKLQVAGMGLFTSGTYNPGDGTPAGVSLGYNTASDYGWIQSVQTGSAFKKLALNPGGGNVGINTDNPVASLHVSGGLGAAVIDPFIIENTGGGLGTGARFRFRLGGFDYGFVSSLVDGAGNPRLDFGSNGSTSVLSIYNSSSVGIGSITSPTARLHLPAGTATANTAPLKLASGTLMTTPETGAIEYDGTHYYATIGSTRYQLDQQSGTTTLDQAIANGNALTTNRTIANSTFQLDISGSRNFADGYTFGVTNTTGTTGIAIKGIAADGRGVWGTATSGQGVYGNATSGNGLFGLATSGNALYTQSTSGLAIESLVQPSSTNTVVPIYSLSRSTSGTAANGIGQSIDFYTATTTATQLANQIISKWTDATNATRTSQFEIWGVNSGTSAQRFTVKGNGQLQGNNYGSATFTGTPATRPVFNSSGDIIEEVHPKIYTSLLTQSGTSDPTAIVLGTNTVGSIVWARTSAGVYTGTLSGAFTADKTWLNAHLSDQSGGTVIIVKLVRTDANTVTLTSLNSSLVATDAFTQISLEIKVYP